MLIPAIIIALLFAFCYNVLIGKDLKQHISRTGQAYIRQLLPAAQFALLRSDDQILQNLINASIINPEIKSLAFYNTNGQIIAYRGGKHSLKHAFTPPNYTGDYIEAKQLNPTTRNYIAPITIPKFNLYANIPFKNNLRHDVLGWISLDIDTHPMVRKQYQMLVATLFITLLSLLMSLVIHYFLARRIYLPIARLRRSMKQILSNGFETEIAVSSPGELGIIEKGCAHLQKKYLCTVQNMHQQIETAREDLQKALILSEEKNCGLTLEKKRTEERSRQKSEFIADMSHEIRTPLNGVIGFTNVLLESKLEPLQLDYVKTIKSSAQDLLFIINDILDFSKINAGKLLLDCIPLDIRACIDEVIALAGPMAQKNGINLISITENKVPKTMLGDPIRLRQIISNLITNAVKFTDLGHVLIRTNIEQETDKYYYLSFTISDTGIGISPDDQNKLFTAFNQADTSITRRYGGSGLGLVICKKLCEQMHGHISFNSKLNQGSTFTAVVRLDKLTAYELEKNSHRKFEHLKALCFDSNPLYLESLCKSLSFWGIESVSVFSYQKMAKAVAKNKDCTIAFIDIHKGCETQVTELIAKNPALSFILLSNYPINEYSAMGAQGFLQKPIYMHKLENMIESLHKGNYIEKSVHPELHNLREQMRILDLDLLIAEDNPVNKMLLNSLLGMNANVALVDDGEMAVSACENKKFNLIMLDLQMPNLNGLEAALKIRKQSLLNKQTPIILISADNWGMNALDLKKSGINFCLQKPIDEKLLLIQILKIADKTMSVIIDWQLCIQKVSGNVTLAEEFLKKFIEELYNNRKEFLSFYQQKNDQGLADTAHKLKGACYFCGVPLLLTKVIAFEEVTAQAQAFVALATPFRELIQSIDAVIDEFNNHYLKKKERECL